jgi:hypothetical protein
VSIWCIGWLLEILLTLFGITAVTNIIFHIFRWTVMFPVKNATTSAWYNTLQCRTSSIVLLSSWKLFNIVLVGSWKS